MSCVTALSGSPPEVEYSSRVDPHYGYLGALEAYELRSCDDVVSVRKVLELALEPPRAEEIIPKLTAIGGALPSKGDATTAVLWSGLAWEAIDNFPRDVVLAALREINRREKWRPAPSEVREECHWQGRRRMGWRRVLRRLEPLG